jgi:hypothetical protein
MTGLLGGLGPGPTRKLWPDLEHPLQDPLQDHSDGDGLVEEVLRKAFLSRDGPGHATQTPRS